MIKRHRVAELSLYLNGKPLSLKGYELMYPLYNDTCNKIIFKAGRQVSKTTTLSNIIMLNSIYIDYYQSIYVTPLNIQADRFSTLYINPTLRSSPVVKHLVNSKTLKSIKMKSFLNGSVIHFTYSSGGEERAGGGGFNRLRSISGSEIDWDELQDHPVDVIPVAEQCLSGPAGIKYGVQRYCGTPKTLENTMEFFWQKSNQNEWVMRCKHCGIENIPILPYALEMIGKNGPRCYKCKMPIDPVRDAIGWIPQCPSKTNIFNGYHIPQIIVPFNLGVRRWRTLYSQFCDPNYSKGRFANEVLGLSYDTGGRLITITELKKLMTLKHDFVYQRREYLTIVAGIDWGISAVKSFTVIVVMGIRPNKQYDVLFHKKFYGVDILLQIDEIINILKTWNVEYCGCDFGVGYTNNQLLRKKWCSNEVFRIVEFQYADAKSLLAWNKRINRYILNRTNSINLLFMELKTETIRFRESANVEKEIFPDLLAIYEEITSGPSGDKKRFSHPPAVPDDFAHAINFALVTGKRAVGQLVVDYDDEGKV